MLNLYKTTFCSTQYIVVSVYFEEAKHHILCFIDIKTTHIQHNI